MKCLPLALCFFLLSACGGPFFMIPGGKLSGEVVDEPIGDWGFIDDAYVELETNPEQPYSVQLNYFVRDGKLYLDPLEGKKWLKEIRKNALVRVRFGEKIYPLKVVLVGKPGELEGFDADRFIYRLDPRGREGS